MAGAITVYLFAIKLVTKGLDQMTGLFARKIAPTL